MENHRRGWLRIPGVQPGERTLEEQLLGLERALAEAKGKHILDLGCAEGLIGQRFAEAGAARVVGVDGLEEHIEVGRRYCPDVQFEHSNLNQVELPEAPSYDIVLALAILHKLHKPEDGTRYAARSARSLVVVRLPIGSSGTIIGKHSGVVCDLIPVFSEEGFALEATVPGPRGERVQYWRKGATP